MNIIFFGTSEFSSIILEKLANSEYKPGLVITMPDRLAGRKQILTPPPAKITAQKYGILLLQPEKIINLKSEILNLKPDLCIVASYGQIIPKGILQIPQYGFLNVHPSLLPKYRGSSPIQTTILNGDKETGVTIMLMDEKMDHGPILATEKGKMKKEKPNYQELHDQLANIGASLLLQTIPLWVNEEIKAKEQDHAKATFTKIIKKEDGLIDWMESAASIERKIRAFEWWPGTYFKLKTENVKGKTKEQVLKILIANVLEVENNVLPGEFFLTSDKKLAIKCGENALLVEIIQPEGKKPMTAKEFLNGSLQFLNLKN